ncbi:hypothetical protein Trydic_g14941 [Trypoxylus dichotomus]
MSNLSFSSQTNTFLMCINPKELKIFNSIHRNRKNAWCETRGALLHDDSDSTHNPDHNTFIPAPQCVC